MMQESLSKYNRLLSFRHKEVILEGVLQFHQRSVYLDCNYTYFFRPQFLNTQKVETLVPPSAIINTHSSKSNYSDTIYLVTLNM